MATQGCPWGQGTGNPVPCWMLAGFSHSTLYADMGLCLREQGYSYELPKDKGLLAQDRHTHTRTLV